MINPIGELAELPEGAYALFRQQVICSKAGTCERVDICAHSHPHAAFVCPISGYQDCPRTECVLIDSMVVITKERPA